MNNLAGIPTDEANAAIIAELAGAGIDAVSVPLDKRREVGSTVDGALRIGDRAFTFRRWWCYWIAAPAAESPAFTLDDAEFVDEWPRPKDARGGYNGNRGCLGDVVRWRGMSGGCAPKEFFRGDPAAVHWHVDTQAGLAGLVEALTARFGGAT